MTSKNSPVFIIDLDETFLSVNSFPLWAKYFLFGKFDSLNFIRRNALRIKTLKLFAERKIFGRDHIYIRDELHKLWQNIDDKTATRNVCVTLAEKIRPNMLSIHKMIKENEIDAVLASAAASVYAEPFAGYAGFSHVLATQAGKPENRGEEKARRISEFLTEKNWQDRKKIFFTDHLEDMPFIKKCDQLMWFGKESEIEEIKSSAPELTIIHCLNLSDKELTQQIK
ncbi:MAG: haloacid dehalogenase-like hydrolase [Rickettsiales bacterium]